MTGFNIGSLAAFKVGDRVTVTSKAFNAALRGKCGDVVSVESSNVSVRFDDGSQRGFFPSSLTRTADPASTFKVGDRVTVDYRSGSGWNGPGTVRQIQPHGVSVYSDSYKGIGFFDHKCIRPIEVTPAVGMSSKDLADAVETTIRQTRSRVLGVGDQQYSTDKGQKFEGLKVSELIRMAREEAQDLVVYAVMTDIRLGRIEAAIEGEGL